MKIKLREGWLSKAMVYSWGEEKWEFSQDKPDHVPECWYAKRDGKGEHRAGELKRIMYVEVADE